MSPGGGFRACQPIVGQGKMASMNSNTDAKTRVEKQRSQEKTRRREGRGKEKGKARN